MFMIFMPWSGIELFPNVSFIELSHGSLLCLMHEGVEGVVEGVHEVGVMDRGLRAWERERSC